MRAKDLKKLLELCHDDDLIILDDTWDFDTNSTYKGIRRGYYSTKEDYIDSILGHRKGELETYPKAVLVLGVGATI